MIGGRIGGRIAEPVPDPSYDAVVLAGGEASRFGRDKLLATVGGRSMLDRVLRAASGARRTVVVGPRRDVGEPAELVWTSEQPPGAGPLAGLAAGLRHCAAPVVVVLAADMPLLDRSVVERLVGALDAPEPIDVAALADATGRLQPLAAAYRSEPLLAALAGLGDPAGQGMLRLLDRLRPFPVPDHRAATDCDTPEELERLEKQMLTEWTERLAAELGLDLERDLALDVNAVLDLARDAAHTVERPAAPVTTFLVGYAAALRGGGIEAVNGCTATALDLIRRWEEPGAASGQE